MALFLIDISWQRRQPDPDRENTGTKTYAEYARSLTRATTQACKKFRRHYGMHLAITQTAEKPDPAAIYQETIQVRDCGSGHDFGVCPICKKGHGHVLMERGIYSAALSTHP